MKRNSLWAVMTALVMALVMLASVPASAATGLLDDNSGADKSVKISGNTSYYKGRRYVSFGDSIAAGFGPYNTTNRGFSRVDEAYPSRLADALGMKLTPLGRNAFRTTELRYMLDSSYKGDEYLFQNVRQVKPAMIKQYRKIFQKEAARADLITVQIGANDITHMALIYAKKVIETATMSTEVLEQLAEYASMEDQLEGLVGVLELAETLGVLPAVAAAALLGAHQGYENFTTNWDKIMRQLYTVNPDVEIIVIGIYNAGKTAQVSEDSDLPIGKILDVAVRQINSYMESGSAYAKYYAYTDCMDVKIYHYTIEQLLDGNTTLVHPTPRGHKYIANQIGKNLKHKK